MSVAGSPSSGMGGGGGGRGTIRVIFTKISNRSGIAVQWNGGFRVAIF